MLAGPGVHDMMILVLRKIKGNPLFSAKFSVVQLRWLQTETLSQISSFELKNLNDYNYRPIIEGRWGKRNAISIMDSLKPFY